MIVTTDREQRRAAFGHRRTVRRARLQRVAARVHAELTAAGTDPERRRDATDTIRLCERAARLLPPKDQDATLAAVACVRSGRLLLGNTREDQLAAARRWAKRGLRSLIGFNVPAPSRVA